MSAIQARDGSFGALFAKLGFNVNPAGPDEQSVRCQFHEDGAPSMSVNIAKGVFKCHGGSCGVAGGVYDAAAASWNATKDEARKRLAAEYGVASRKNDNKNMSADACDAEYRRSRQGLDWTTLPPDDFRAKLALTNCWSLAALEHAKAGFFPTERRRPARVVLAIFDPSGTKIIGTKLRAMTACDRAFRSITHGKIGLIGGDRLNARGERTVGVSAGEKDMLRAMTATPEIEWVSHAGGEDASLASWAQPFSGVKTVLVYDADQGGESVWKRAAELVGHTAVLRVVKLPFVEGERNAAGGIAKDLTDFLEEHGGADLLALIDGTAVVGRDDARLVAPRSSTPSARAVLDEFPASVEIAAPLFTLDDIGNAERFVRDHGSEVLFDYGSRTWRVWDTRRWAVDVDQAVVRLAMRTVRAIRQEGGDCDDPVVALQMAKHAKSSANSARISAMLKLSEPKLGVPASAFDAEPLVFNVLNGTIDLRTGSIRPHRRADRITKLAAVTYDAAAKCPRFERFLAEVFLDAATVDLIRRAVGYTLTGLTVEQVLIILVGVGANGKGTFLRAIKSILGDYAAQASMESFLIQRADASRPREDLAALVGARLVAASEVGEDRKLDEATVKHLTGGDAMRARRLYENSFEYVPSFKLWLDTNYLPRITGTDEGIWRRVIPIEMPASFRGNRGDRHLDEALRAEAPGILAWALRGAVEWQRTGLRVPEIVDAARQRYRTKEDIVGAFIDDTAVLDPAWAVLAGPLYTAFREWCEASGAEPLTQRRFSDRLESRGLIGGKDSSGQRIRKGLRLNASSDANRSLARQGQFRLPKDLTCGGSGCGA